MTGTCRPLIEVLAEIEDPRHARGIRHPFAAILALAVVATLCGAFAQSLGFNRAQTPCASTLYFAFRALDRQALERALSAWAETLLSATRPPRAKWRPSPLMARRCGGPNSRGRSRSICSRCSPSAWAEDRESVTLRVGRDL